MLVLFGFSDPIHEHFLVRVSFPNRIGNRYTIEDLSGDTEVLKVNLFGWGVQNMTQKSREVFGAAKELFPDNTIRCISLKNLSIGTFSSLIPRSRKGHRKTMSRDI